uniref:Uncharacterized protein n=1 Tax=Romanomermis culicivorax TaxID=13658 RepID=A0A915KBU8_ROMCU
MVVQQGVSEEMQQQFLSEGRTPQNSGLKSLPRRVDVLVHSFLKRLISLDFYGSSQDETSLKRRSIADLKSEQRKK